MGEPLIMVPGLSTALSMTEKHTMIQWVSNGESMGDTVCTNDLSGD